MRRYALDPAIFLFQRADQLKGLVQADVRQADRVSCSRRIRCSPGSHYDAEYDLYQNISSPSTRGASAS
jgi:hypothetical protein